MIRKTPQPKRKASNIATKQTMQMTSNKAVTSTPGKSPRGGAGNADRGQPAVTAQVPKKKKARKQSRDPRGRGKRR